MNPSGGGRWAQDRKDFIDPEPGEAPVEATGSGFFGGFIPLPG